MAKARYWLMFFLGGIVATIVGLIIYLIIGDDVNVKDILPSLITGIVTFAALFFTYINNREQREVLIKTTIEKEWIESIRKSTSDVIANCFAADALLAVKGLGKKISDNDDVKMLEALNAILRGRTLLTMYLDNSDPLQKNLLDAAESVYLELSKGDTASSSERLNEASLAISIAAHKLFAKTRVE